jgi:hypothetical protein
MRQINFKFSETAAPGGLTPDSMDSTSATKGTLTGLTTGNWSLVAGSNGTPQLRHTGIGEGVSTNTLMNLTLQGITNHDIGAADCDLDAEPSSDTCFIRLSIYSDYGTTLVDEGVATYTVVSSVTVSARVDPSFTFGISAVAADQVRNQITTSVASTYSSLPFSNLQANTPKYAAHKLNVTTNTQGGYTIYAKLTTAMTGSYSQNNIDPFIGPWGTPTTWTQPTGTTPNTNTGWLGANTTDGDISGWSGAVQKFGGISTSNNAVMSGTASDDGTSAVYVTYGIEANVFQPADTYTGYLIYTALPKY